MPDLNSIGKSIVIIGLILVLLGGIIMVGGKIGFIGKLPGDMYFEKGNVKFYFPLVTMLLLSFIITVIVNLIFRH
ncbi:MAG: DUF2905 domain-containing protein [Clostridiales bacterium]|nr:DUF2905 domain-containing protein [Clostridiales bacterium]MCF8022114.1 DUF2905 domain-containing protein [Clostridiales bacterium]